MIFKIYELAMSDRGITLAGIRGDVVEMRSSTRSQHDDINRVPTRCNSVCTFVRCEQRLTCVNDCLSSVCMRD